MSSEITPFQESLKNELLAVCDEEYASTLELTPKDISNIEKYAKNILSGQKAFLPAICVASRCSYKATCPLLKIGKAPISKQCPFEIIMIRKWQDEYAASLDINLDDKSEKSLLEDLVEIDILNARANSILGDEGLTVDNPIGISEATGEAITRQELHSIVILKEKIHKRKDGILKSFLATRESKANTNSTKEDITQYIARLKDKANALEKAHKTIVDAEVTETTGEVKNVW